MQVNGTYWIEFYVKRDVARVELRKLCEKIEFHVRQLVLVVMEFGCTSCGNYMRFDVLGCVHL